MKYMIKTVLLLSFILVFVVGCTYTDDEDTYFVNLKNSKKIICGKEYYLTNYTNGQEFEIDRILELFQECINEYNWRIDDLEIEIENYKDQLGY